MAFITLGFVALFLVAFIPRETSAIGCYVCHSVNGSNPDCEVDQMDRDIRNNNQGTYLQRNCKSLDASQDKRTLNTAQACVTILGEYRDPRTQRYAYVLSRDCSANVPGWSVNRNVRCGPTNIDGYLRWTSQNSASDQLYQSGVRNVDGCQEICSGDQCNGRGIHYIGERFREQYWEQHLDAQTRQFTKSRIPAIFEIRERRYGWGCAPDASGTGLCYGPLTVYGGTLSSGNVVGWSVVLMSIFSVFAMVF